MKRISAFLLAAACTLFTFTAFAQEPEIYDEQPEAADTLKPDQMIFNHLSVGVSFGLDGIGGHVAAPIGRHFGVRAGYTFIPSYNSTIPDLPVVGSKIDAEDLKFKVNEGSANEKEFDLSKVDLGVTINNFGPHLLFDLYPGKKSGFHFTLGAVMAQHENFVSATADLSDQLKDITVDDGKPYETFGISYKNVETITTDPDGVLHLDLRTNKIHPYVGIGFGRPLNMRHRVSVNFDLGVVYVGKYEVYSYDYNAPGHTTADVQITSAKLDNEDDGIIDNLGKYPFFPVMKLSINVRLF